MPNRKSFRSLFKTAPLIRAGALRGCSYSKSAFKGIRLPRGGVSENAGLMVG
jgi:hypothetical protein